MKDRTGVGGSPAGSEFSTVEPRCKVCRSPHRREIEIMLATGWPQAWVRRHWNEFLGADHFTANNLSVHARRHLNFGDPHIASFLTQGAGAATSTRTDPEEPDELLNLREQVARIVRYEYAALDAGLLLPDVGDMLRTIELLGKLENEAWPAERAHLRRDLSAFVRAVANIVPEREEEIFAEYERLLDQSTPEGKSSRAPRWIL